MAGRSEVARVGEEGNRRRDETRKAEHEAEHNVMFYRVQIAYDLCIRKCT